MKLIFIILLYLFWDYLYNNIICQKTDIQISRIKKYLEKVNVNKLNFINLVSYIRIKKLVQFYLLQQNLKLRTTFLILLRTGIKTKVCKVLNRIWKGNYLY